MLRLKRVVDVWVCCFGLLACAGGGAHERPSASAADARLAEPASKAPEASSLVQQGESKLAQNDAAGAKQLFEQALVQNTADSRAALDLGIACELLNDPAGAEAAYRRALESKPDLAQAQNNLGVLLRAKGELSEAISWLERASLSDTAAVHQNLALAYEDQNNLDGAATQYARAVELAPEDAMTRANYGLLLLKLHKPDQAVHELEQAREGAKGNRAALLAIGNGLRRAGANEAALLAMQSAVSAGGEPATPALLSELALAQRGAGKRAEAEVTLQKVLSMDDSYATAHYLLGNMLAADHHFADAKQHYQRYLELAPNGAQAARAKERLAVIAKSR